MCLFRQHVGPRFVRSNPTGTVAKRWFAIHEAHSLTHPPAL